MSYYIARTSSRSFDAVVADVIERLKAGDPALAATAQEVRQRLIRAVSAVAP